MTRAWFLVVVIIAAMTTFVARNASAAPILVVNHGFELPVQGNGNYTNEIITGWTVEGTASIEEAGVYDPPSGEITPSEGVQVAYLGPFGAPAASISQILAASLLPSTTYTLQVDVGRRAGSPDAGYGLSLLAGLDVLATSQDVFDLPVGTMSTATLMFTSPADLGTLSGLLQIRLFNPTGFGQTNYDNVRLDAGVATLPEPASLFLFGTALSGLVAASAGRRRRA